MNWSSRSRQFIEHNDIIMRSLLVLKLMSYQYSGAVLAALTTSLPESIGEVRNWDYRFCWVRRCLYDYRHPDIYEAQLYG